MLSEKPKQPRIQSALAPMTLVNIEDAVTVEKEITDSINANELLAFEKEIADLFTARQIRAPIHLSGGNENQLIAIFRDVKPTDWVFSTWRSHYHALLKGIPADWLKAEIVAGRSMYICNNEHRFISSAIVGGILPIALGLALGIKRQGGSERVWCFIGDMTARTGICWETCQYARGQNLPMTFVVEDNGLSTNTPTLQVWGEGNGYTVNQLTYSYKRQYPHTGLATWVTFG